MSRPIHPDYVPSSYDPLPGADSPEIAALPLQSSSSSSKPPPPKAGNAAWISTASLFDFSDDVLESLSIAAAGGSDAAHSSASAASAASAAHQHVLPRLSPAAASSSSASSSSFSSFAIPAAPSANRSARPAAVAMGAFDAEAGASQSVLFAVPTHSQRSKQMQQLQMQQQRQQFPLQNAPAARPGANAHISTFDSYVQNESQMCASAAVLPSLHASQWASSSSSASAYDSAAAFAASELAPQVSHEDRYRAAMLAVIRRNEALSDDELALNSFESAQQRAARLAPIVLAPSQPPAAQPENQPHEPHSLASFEVPLASRKRGADQINRAEDGIASSSSSSSSSSVSSIPPLERGSDSSNNNVPAAAESIPAPAPLAAPAMIRESDEDAKAAERLRLLEVELEQKRAAAKKKKAKSFV